MLQDTKASNRKPQNSYTSDQVAKCKRLILEADYTVDFAPGEVERISRESGIAKDMVNAIVQGRAHVGIEPAPVT